MSCRHYQKDLIFRRGLGGELLSICCNRCDLEMMAEMPAEKPEELITKLLAEDFTQQEHWAFIGRKEFADFVVKNSENWRELLKFLSDVVPPKHTEERCRECDNRLEDLRRKFL